MTTPRNYSILTLKCKDYSHDGYVANFPVFEVTIANHPLASSGNLLPGAYHFVFSNFYYFSSGITLAIWYLRAFANYFIYDYPSDLNSYTTHINFLVKNKK